MEYHIEKLIQKFNMQGCRTYTTPEIHISTTDNVEKSKPNTTFPIRSIVGGLLYISTI